MTTKIRVYRADHTGTGILQSEHDRPSDAIRAARDGKAADTPSPLNPRPHWYVAFPLSDGRWDTYSL